MTPQLAGVNAAILLLPEKTTFCLVSLNIYIYPVFSLLNVLEARVCSWEHELHRYANQHSAIYIVLLSAYEVVDVNSLNAFPYVHFKSKWHVDL